ncbi:GSK3-beta interaction protein [Vespula squamosa]|uniref:GSK3-beta interaction protein n=1 Tax=Vespula squamosa TaxID=30214 RepID=A0ABD2ACB0_VESSQ
MTNMENNEDKILDEEQWKLEAQAVINDIKNHVNDVKLSDRLCSFTIVGNKHDDASNKGNQYFETPYSLLNSTSPQYRDSFGNLLLEKLKELSQE